MSQEKDAPAESSNVRRSPVDSRPPFVPTDFRVPDGLAHDDFRLVPLGPEHNDRDYRAWTSSFDHVRRTPGFEHYGWPVPMSCEDNLRDLVQHAEDFRRRVGFTYSVLIDDDVIGCVYIYPLDRPGHATVRSWVTEARTHLDLPLYEAVEGWLRTDWPFSGFSYSPRMKEPEFAN
jgi:hypothetical protein